MRTKYILAGGILILAACSAPAAGQSVPPTEPPVTIRTTVNEVLLDFVVRDKHGRPVKNLKPEEVQIYEDGVRRDLLSFRLDSGTKPAPEHRADEEKHEPPTAVAAPTPAVATNPSGRSLRALNVICIVFQNLDPNTRLYAVAAAEQFLRNDLQPGTWVGIFSLGDRLTPLHQFTTNREELIAAVHNVSSGTGLDFMSAAETILSAEPIMATITLSGSGGPGGGGVSADLTVTGGELNTLAINGADVATSRGANMRRGAMVGDRRQFAHIEGMRETDQIILMIQQLAKLPGRKTVLLFSPGLVTTGDADRFQSILKKANHSEISFFAIDATGLSQNSNVVGSVAALKHVAALSQSQGRRGDSPGVMMERMRQDDYLIQAVRTSDPQASLRALAEGTGGFLIGSTNDLKKPFEHVVEEIDTHYEAVYRPTSEQYDGHLRKIEVKVTRPDLTVEARPGYFALPDVKSARLTSSDVLGLLALERQPRPHAFDFRAAALQFGPEGEGHQYALTYELPVSDLTATPEPEQKRHRLRFSLLGLVKDSKGQVVDWFGQDTPYDIPDEKLAGLQALSIPYSHMLNLPAGHYTVETAVLDRQGSRDAIGEFAIDSPENKGIGLSSVMLVKQVEPAKGRPDDPDPFRVGNDRVTPDLATALSPNAKPYVYFVVYPDKANAAKPRIEVRFLLDGQILARQVAELPAPDANGVIPMLIGSAARPGNCEIRITAVQGAETRVGSVKYRVAAN